MGFDAGILENKDSPKWSFKEVYEKKFQSYILKLKDGNMDVSGTPDPLAMAKR